MVQAKVDVKKMKTMAAYERFEMYLRQIELSVWGAAHMLGMGEEDLRGVLRGGLVPKYEVRLRIAQWTRTWAGGEIGVGEWANTGRQKKEEMPNAYMTPEPTRAPKRKHRR